MGRGGGIFLVGGGGWTSFMGGWVGGDRQRYILNRWRWVDIFYGWVGIFGGRLRYILFG